VLGIPPEFKNSPIRCGACNRVIQQTEHRGGAPGRCVDDVARFTAEDDDTVNRNLAYDDDDLGNASTRRRQRRSRTEADDDTTSTPRKPRWILGVLAGLTALGLVCCGCAGFIVYKATELSWSNYTPSGNEFTATFPREPIYDSQQFTWPDGSQGKIHQYLSSLMFQRQLYMVQFTDLPRGLGGKVWRDVQLNAMLDEMKKPGSFMLKEEGRTETSLGGQPAKEVYGPCNHPEYGDGYMFSRVAIINQRVYVLIALGKDRGSIEERKDRFFNSLSVQTMNAPREN
jgi:hypothetical protein